MKIKFALPAVLLLSACSSLAVLPKPKHAADLEKLAAAWVTAEFKAGASVADACAFVTKETGVRVEAGEHVLANGLAGEGTALAFLLEVARESRMHVRDGATGIVLSSVPAIAGEREYIEALALGECVGGLWPAFASAEPAMPLNADFGAGTHLGDALEFICSVFRFVVEYEKPEMADRTMDETKFRNFYARAAVRTVCAAAELHGYVVGNRIFVGSAEWMREKVSPGRRDPLSVFDPPIAAHADTREGIRVLRKMSMRVDFKATKLSQVLEYFRDFVGITILIAGDLEETDEVNIQADKTALEILQDILAPARWRFVLDGRTLIVGTPHDLREHFGARAEGPDGGTKNGSAADYLRSVAKQMTVTPAAAERAGRKIVVPWNRPQGAEQALLEQAGIRVVLLPDRAVAHARLDVKAETARWKEIADEAFASAAEKAKAGLADLEKERAALEPALADLEAKVKAAEATVDAEVAEAEAQRTRDLEREEAALAKAVEALGFAAADKARDDARDAHVKGRDARRLALATAQQDWYTKTREAEAAVEELTRGGAAKEKIEAARKAHDALKQEADRALNDLTSMQQAAETRDIAAAEKAEKTYFEVLVKTDELKVDHHRRETAAHAAFAKRAEMAGEKKSGLAEKVRDEHKPVIAARDALYAKSGPLDHAIEVEKGRAEARSLGELPLPALVTIKVDDGRVLENVILHAANVGAFTLEKAGWKFRFVEPAARLKITTPPGRSVDPLTLLLK